MQYREMLIKHLIEIEDNKEYLLQEAVCQEEKKEIEKMLDNYLRQVESIIQNSSSRAVNRLPFALIGSRITVENMESGETWTIRLSSPLNESIKAEDVSFLSPLGKYLLLRKEGDKVEAQTEEEKLELLIRSINHSAFFA